MFRRPARLPVNVTLGIPYEGSTPDTEENNTTTQDNLRIAFEHAETVECAAKQTVRNKTVPPYPVFHPDQQVLAYRPNQDSDGPNPKLLLPRREPCVLHSLSPLVYQVSRMEEKREISVHIAHVKTYHPRETPPAPFMT